VVCSPSILAANGALRARPAVRPGSGGGGAYERLSCYGSDVGGGDVDGGC
jgi:hypothetical protein